MVLVSSFFASMQPIACIFCLIGLFLLYWTKKYLLLNRYTRPEDYGKSVNAKMMGFIDFAPFFFSFGSLMAVNLFLQRYNN